MKTKKTLYIKFIDFEERYKFYDYLDKNGYTLGHGFAKLHVNSSVESVFPILELHGSLKYPNMALRVRKGKYNDPISVFEFFNMIDELTDLEKARKIIYED